MWNTFTAGLQLVQEKLDNVLDDSQAEQDVESPDGAGPSSATPPDSQMMITTQPPSPSQVMVTTQPPSPVRVEQPPPPQAPPPQESLSRLQKKVVTLQQALDQAEQQRELINSEYRRLLGEKEKEIASLKEQVQVTTPLSIDHTSNIEILQKELAAHKEMVAELRDQLKEKEAEFQELNGKAESKFNRLKVQAKTKIASLSSEVERLKEEKEGVATADDSVNTSSYLSISSLDDSISTGTFSPPAPTMIADHTPKEVESLQTELTTLKEEVCQGRVKGEELRAEIAALKDKLNVSEVCLQKEQESRVSMELQVTRMEEHLDQVTSELSLAHEERRRLDEELEQAQRRNMGLSEELSLARSSTPDHGQAELQLAEGLPPVGSMSPSVMAAGERGSLLDMESEISSLESTIRERDEQLSSFKTVLEEKESLLEKQLEKEAKLSRQIHTLHQETEVAQTSHDSVIERLKAELSTSQLDACNAGETVKHLESSVADLESAGEALKQLVQEKDSRLSQLENAIQEAETAREKLEADLSKKLDEVWSLSASVDSQKQSLEEKEAGIIRNISHITTLEQSVQEFRLSNESLRSNIDSSKEETVEKIRELESQVLELQGELQASVREREVATTASRQLEDSLATTRESLQQREESQRGANESFSQQQDQTQQEIWDLKHRLEVHTGEFQTAIGERDNARKELEVTENSLTDATRALEVLKSEKEALTAQFTECKLQVTKSSGALEFAQEELAGKDRTIKSLSGALEEKNAALVSVETKAARLKSELAEKMTELMQHSEQSVQSKAALEEELREVRARINFTAEEVKRVHEELNAATREKASIKTELGVTLARLEMQDREREASQVESETLRGKVGSLSKAQNSQSQQQQRQLESITDLTSHLAQKSSQVQSLQQKLEVAKDKLGKAVEERDRAVKKRSEAEEKLGKHEKENEQMKQQFDSAVELMEAKVSEKSVAIARTSAESAQKASEISSLHDQLTGEARKRSEMQERVMKLSADHKVSGDRCRLLENEKGELQRTLGDLTSRHSHLEHSFSDAISERESLQHQHHTSLASVQEYEAKMVDLTDQLGKLAREKHALESQLHDLGKQVLSSEQSKLSAAAELEQLRGLVQSAGSWDSKKQVLLGEKAVLEQEKAQLQEEEAHLRSRVAGLESSLEKLEEDLGQSHAEVETLIGLSSPAQNNPEHQKQQLSELQQTHAAELTRLHHTHSSELLSVQQVLQEERKRREVAEKSLEAQGEVVISMEDVQPFAAVGAGETGPATLVTYMNMASVWVQRLIKNPNIVLTRLLRATHQTKLLLLGYLLVLHLLLLYLIIV